MSAERELKLLAEIEQARRTAEYWKSEHIAANVEIERLRAEIDEIKQVEFPRRVQKVADVWRGKVDALRAEIERQKARYALLEESYSLLRTEIEAMRGKINELHAQIQRLITERNAFGLAIDRAISGIVPDEHPLRSRLVEIAAMRAQPAPSVPDDNDTHDPSTAAIEYALKAEEGLDFLYYWFHGDFDVIRREWSDAPEDVFIGADPLYRAPGAQENNDERT